MNKRQKIVQGRFLDNEEAVIKRLNQVYNQALKDVEGKAAKLHKEFEELTKALDDVEDEAEREVLKSRIRSKVYQKNYQEGLKKQINGILDNMHESGYKTVSEYLDRCYEDGFCGAMYDLQGQGIPLAFPIDQEAVTRAVQLDSKISEGLYNHLGEDTTMLKKHITSQVSRGIATGMSYSQIARNLSGKMTGLYGNPGGSLAYAQRIARTEGHRIQCQAAMDCCYKAREKGADVVKQWDSTLDARTRDSHAKVDGEIKELEEKFSNGLMFPGDPNGKAAEVINCRCALLERARWAAGAGFSKMNNFTKQIEDFESPVAYDDFKKAFFSKENRQYMNYVTELEERYETKNFEQLLGKMTDREYKHFTDLQNKSPWFNKNVLTKSGSNGKIPMGANPTPTITIGGTDVTITKESYGFGDGTAKGIKKTCDAVVYTTTDGTKFVFPKKYDKTKQTMTPEQAISAWQKVPETVRKKAQKTIEFVDYYNPQDTYWRKVYKNFPHSYATGGEKITFYRYGYKHNDDYLVRTYCHEAGHYIDTQLATVSTRYSDESLWSNAMLDDLTLTKKKSCTKYGENAPTEDFAESVAEFIKDESAFTKQFPNRAALLKNIF